MNLHNKPIIGNFMHNNAQASLITIDPNNKVDLLLEYIAKTNYGELQHLLMQRGYNVENDLMTMMSAKLHMDSGDEAFEEVIALHPDREMFETNTRPSTQSSLALPSYLNMTPPAPSATPGAPAQANLDLSSLEAVKKLLSAESSWCIKVNLLTISLGLVGFYALLKIYEHFRLQK